MSRGQTEAVLHPRADGTTTKKILVVQWVNGTNAGRRHGVFGCGRLMWGISLWRGKHRQTEEANVSAR